jgi:hypothetical protein
MRNSYKIILSGIRICLLLILFTHYSLQMHGQEVSQQSNERFSLQVHVYDEYSNKLTDVLIQVENLSTGIVQTLRFDSIQKKYLLDSTPSGKVKISVSAPNYLPEVRIVEIVDDERIQTFSFYLGRPGMAFTYFDGNRFPFEEDRNKIIVYIKPGNQNRLSQLSQKLGLKSEKSTGDLPEMWVLTKQTPFTSRNCSELLEIRKQSYVISAGPVYKRRGEIQGYFTTRINVRVKTSVSKDTVSAQFKKLNLYINPSESDVNYTVSVKLSVGYGINEIMAELSKLDFVEWINPEIQPINKVPSNK